MIVLKKLLSGEQEQSMLKIQNNRDSMKEIIQAPKGLTQIDNSE